MDRFAKITKIIDCEYDSMDFDALADFFYEMQFDAYDNWTDTDLEERYQELFGDEDV